MEKFTLKEIAGHLPDVEILILNYKCDYVGIERAKVNGHYFIGEDIYLTYVGGSTGKKLGTDCKLILRSIEMLTKTIVHNGVEIIPCDFIFPSDEFDKLINYSSKKYAEDFINAKDPLKLCYEYSYWQKLYELHFDIHNLIERGLAVSKAIDKSTLNSK